MVDRWPRFHQRWNAIVAHVSRVPCAGGRGGRERGDEGREGKETRGEENRPSVVGRFRVGLARKWESVGGRRGGRDGETATVCGNRFINSTTQLTNATRIGTAEYGFGNRTGFE